MKDIVEVGNVLSTISSRYKTLDVYKRQLLKRDNRNRFR